MISTRTRVMIGLMGLLVLALPVAAQPPDPNYHYHSYPYYSGEFRIHVGSFEPNGSSEYWHSINNDFTSAEPSDFRDLTFGADYLFPLNPHMSIIFSGSWYEGSSSHSYRNFLDENNNRIRHDTTLDIASGTVGLMFHVLPRGTPIQPYVAFGGGIYPWRLEENGDFIDFGRPTLPIFHSHLSSSGTAFGYYGLVGLDVPVSRVFGIYAEGRWTWAEDTLKDDFEGFGKLDLGGREVVAGLTWRW